MIREARVADAGEIGRVHVASWRTTYQEIVPQDYLARLDAEDRKDFWQRILADRERRSIVLVAEDPQGRIAGFVSGGPEHDHEMAGYDGELYAIYLHADAQRQGIGKQLAVALSQRLLQQGVDSLLVWVLKENYPARRFYEALGGVYLTERDIEIGGMALKEVAYGWADIQSLVKVGEERGGDDRRHYS